LNIVFLGSKIDWNNLIWKYPIVSIIVQEQKTCTDSIWAYSLTHICFSYFCEDYQSTEIILTNDVLLSLKSLSDFISQ
jgi:hypothetical protein